MATGTGTIAGMVRDYVIALPPLTAITQDSVLAALGLPRAEYQKVNAAFQNNSTNAQNTIKRPPTVYFAVRVNIPTPQGQRDTYLSLPNVESKYVLALNWRSCHQPQSVPRFAHQTAALPSASEPLDGS